MRGGDPQTLNVSILTFFFYNEMRSTWSPVEELQALLFQELN